MEIVKKGLEDVMVSITEPGFIEKLVVKDADGKVTADMNLITIEEDSSFTIKAPYGGTVQAIYGAHNQDTLYIPGNDPKSIRKAATRRVADIRVGV